MQFAEVNKIRRKPSKGARGTCPLCGAAMIAKCGSYVLHHWAHAANRNCDPWWENETQWHRDWKSNFPEYCREVSHRSLEGEIHRADIKTPTGIVIEIQHSTMSEHEMSSREKFYQNLVWILDGRGFSENFTLGHMLPDPNAPEVRDIIWMKPGRRASPWTEAPVLDKIPPFFRVSEIANDHPGFTKSKLHSSSGIMARFHIGEEVADMVTKNYIGHHLFYWIRPRKIWMSATCPVYIDFGEQLLYRMEVYDETKLMCVRLVAKQKLIQDVMVVSNATQIATKFHPVN